MPVILSSSNDGSLALPLPLTEKQKVIKSSKPYVIKPKFIFRPTAEKMIKKCQLKLEKITTIMERKGLKGYKKINLYYSSKSEVSLKTALENDEHLFSLYNKLKMIKDENLKKQISGYNKSKKIFFELCYEPDEHFFLQAKEKIDYINKIQKKIMFFNREGKMKLAKVILEDTNKIIEKVCWKLRTITVKCAGEISNCKSSIPLFLTFKTKEKIEYITDITKFELFYKKNGVQLESYLQDKKNLASE